MDLSALGIKGIGSEGVVLLTLFLLVKELIIPMWKRIQGKNGRTGTLRLNPNSKPGNAQVCKDNNDEIVKLKTKFEGLEKKVEKHCDQNREDHKSMFEKIDDLIKNRR